MGVQNIFCEILVIAVARELVSCVQPRNELGAQMLLVLILDVCFVEIDDVPKDCCTLEAVPLREFVGLLRHTIEVNLCE